MNIYMLQWLFRVILLCHYKIPYHSIKSFLKHYNCTILGQHISHFSLSKFSPPTSFPVLCLTNWFFFLIATNVYQVMKTVFIDGNGPGSVKWGAISWSVANIPETAIPIMSSPRFSDWWTTRNKGNNRIPNTNYFKIGN